MNFTICKTEISVSPVSFTLLSLLLYTERREVIAAIILSVTVHETAHLAAMKFLREKIGAVAVNPWGLSIHCIGAVEKKEKLLSTFAGPAAGLLLWLLCVLDSKNSFTDLLALYSLRLSLLNLIPCLPLDGGNILSQLTLILLPEHDNSDHIKLLSVVFASAVMIAGLVFAGVNGGTYVLFIGIYLMYFNMSEESL